MKQTYNTRHYWLTVKQTIGSNTFSSMLDNGCTPYHASSQATYTIDILSLITKISAFWEKFTVKITPTTLPQKNNNDRIILL